MSLETARQAVVSRVETQLRPLHPTTSFYYENRVTVDLATQIDPFVVCEVVFTDAMQKTLELSPMVRFRGSIWLGVYVRCSHGTAPAYAIMDSIVSVFRTAQFGGLTTGAPSPAPGSEEKGWRRWVVRIPFWFDSPGA